MKITTKRKKEEDDVEEEIDETPLRKRIRKNYYDSPSPWDADSYARQKVLDDLHNDVTKLKKKNKQQKSLLLSLFDEPSTPRPAIETPSVPADLPAGASVRNILASFSGFAVPALLFAIDLYAKKGQNSVVSKITGSNTTHAVSNNSAMFNDLFK